MYGAGRVKQNEYTRFSVYYILFQVSNPFTQTYLGPCQTRSSLSEVLLGDLKICSKFTGEHPRHFTGDKITLKFLKTLHSTKFTYRK